MKNVYEFNYDIKNEVNQFRNSQKDNIYKFLLYKADKSTFDCDRCDYAKSVYHSLWGFNNNVTDNFQPIKVGKNKILMGMDTMNSFWRTFAWALNTWCKDDIEREFAISHVDTQSCDELIKNYSALKNIIINNLSEEIYDQFNKFAALTHTIGNLILVPKTLAPHTKNQSFNQARASVWNDYFDLSLMWLLENDEEIWNTDTIKEYRKIFVLESYISDNGEIIPLNAEHKQILTGENIAESRPQTKEQLRALLNNINARIIHRGKILHSRLTNTNNKSNTSHNDKKTSNAFQNKDEALLKKGGRMFTSYFAFNILISFILLLPWPIGLIFELSTNIFNSIGGVIIALILGSIFSIAFMMIPSYLLARRRKKIFLNSQNKNSNVTFKKYFLDKKESKIPFIIIILFDLFSVYAMISSGDFTENHIIENILLFYSCIMLNTIPWYILYFVKGFRTCCKSCKCFYTIKKISTTQIGEKDVNVKTEIENVKYLTIGDSNKETRVIERQEVIVPGVRKEYETLFKCKWCGASYYTYYSRDVVKT